jgi:hypothetical protein
VDSTDKQFTVHIFLFPRFEVLKAVLLKTILLVQDAVMLGEVKCNVTKGVKSGCTVKGIYGC